MKEYYLEDKAVVVGDVSEKFGWRTWYAPLPARVRRGAGGFQLTSGKDRSQGRSKGNKDMSEKITHSPIRQAPVSYSSGSSDDILRQTT